MGSLTAILIHPPLGTPALPSWDMAKVAGALAGTGVTPVLYDANLEYYREVLLSRARVDLKQFQKKTFYDPQQFLLLRKKINDCLIRASHDELPLGLPGGRQVPEQEAALAGPGSNTAFARVCEQGLGRELDRHGPGLAILFVNRPAQRVPAQIMARFIQSGYPGIRGVAMATPGRDLPENQGFEGIIWNQGQQGLTLLADYIFQTFGVKIDPAVQIPDFTGLPLERYLTPARVFPIDPFYFQDPEHLSVFLEDQVKNLEAQGFVFIQNEFEFDKIQDLLDPREKSQENFLTRICHRLGPWLGKKSPDIYFSIQARISTESPASEIPWAPLVSSGLKLIQWKIDGDLPEIQSRIFWEAAKQGIWNHVQLSGSSGRETGPIKFIVNNPNMVHSFEDLTQASPRDLCGYQRVPRELRDYGALEPLPGIPFWEHLGDTTCLLAYLGQTSQKALAALRADIEEESLICLGSQIKFYYQSPRDLPQGILDEICKMVAAGGSVDTTHVRSNLERAYLIGYAMENGVLVGNSSLKHPRKEFILRINQITGLDFTDFVERGYTSVRPEYRAMGVGAQLLAGLTQRAGAHKVFSIISEENLATQKIAVRNRTRKIFTYFSEKMNKQMGVWMPESMIETLKKTEKQGDPGK